MSVIVQKVANDIVLCPTGMKDAINADPLITAVCEIVTVNDGVNVDVTFDVALSGPEDTALEDIMDLWDNSLCTTGTGTDTEGVEFDSGLSVENDTVPLVGDVDKLNFIGTVAARTPQPGQADVYVGSIEVKNVDTIPLNLTDPVHAVGEDVNGVLEIIRAEAGDPTRMPALGVLQEDLAVGATGLVAFNGELKNVDTLTFSVGDEVWVGPTGSGVNAKPTGKDNQIQKIAQVLKASSAPGVRDGSAIIFGAGRSNDVPNIEQNHIWMGDVNDVAQPYNLAASFITQATATIAPGATTTVLTFAPSLNAGTKYIVSVVDTVTGEVAASEVLGSYKQLGDVVSHNHYAKIGDKIKYSPSLAFTSPNVEFNVKNNDTNPITVSVTRIPMLSA